MSTEQLTGDELIAWVRKNVVKWDKPVQKADENVAGLQSMREEKNREAKARIASRVDCTAEGHGQPTAYRRTSDK